MQWYCRLKDLASPIYRRDRSLEVNQFEFGTESEARQLAAIMIGLKPWNSASDHDRVTEGQVAFTSVRNNMYIWFFFLQSSVFNGHGIHAITAGCREDSALRGWPCKDTRVDCQGYSTRTGENQALSACCHVD